MDSEPKISFENISFRASRIHFTEEASPTETAKEIIKHATEPYIELEKNGYIKGLRIILYGGTINKLKTPKDYDLLVLYDKFSKESRDPNKLTNNAQRIKEELFYDSDTPQQDIAYAVDYRSMPSKFKVPHAKYAEIFLTSKETFLKHLSESDEEKKARAFQKLITLPAVIFDLYAPSTEIYNSEPYIDWVRVENSVLFCLILARGFAYEYGKPEINYMKGYSPKLSKLLKSSSGTNTTELVNQYIDNNISTFLSKKEREKMQQGLTENNGANIKVMGEFVKNYLKNAKLNGPIGERVLSIVEAIKRKMNLEETIVSSGHLLYGENIINRKRKVFVEDTDYIDFSSTLK